MRTRAIPEHLRGVFTTRRYTNTRLPLPLPSTTGDTCVYDLPAVTERSLSGIMLSLLMMCNSQTHVQSALGDVVSSSGQNEHLSVMSAVDVTTTNRSARSRHRVYTYTGMHRYGNIFKGKR